VGIAGAGGNAVGHSAGIHAPHEAVIVISFHPVRDVQDNLLRIVDATG
jgi:hypothetical protein